MPRSVPALLSKARGVVEAMTGNPAFPSPTPPLSAVTAAIDDLQSAQVAAEARTRGAVTVRNDKRTALITVLHQVASYVQGQADASMETGSAIIQSAGFGVRKTSAPAARVFAAKTAGVSGAVRLVAPPAARRASYEWEYSSDGGATWTTAPVTLRANTTIAGLKPASTVLFRYRAVTTAGEANWSQSVSLVVQ